MKLLLSGAAAAVLIAGLAYPPARMAALTLAGRGAGCPASNAWKIAAEKQHLTAVKDRILAASRLIETDAHGLQHWDTPHGRFWTPPKSDYILPFNLAEQETKIYGSGEHAVKPGDVVLDCGANVGVFTREALSAGAKTVVAIEPAPDNIECLRRTFSAEIAAGKVILYPKGVWDKDDMLELHVDEHNQAADSFVIHREGAKAVAKVPLTTIDKLVAELTLPSVDYIKMDIEGAEVKALIGGKQSIAKYHPRMSLSVYHQDDHPVEVPKAAKDAWSGYTVTCGPCNYVESQRRIRPDILYFR